MKRISLILVAILMATMFVACSGSEENAPAANSTQNAQENAPQNGGQNENGEGNMQARGNGITGLVTDVIGNEITIQVGEMEGGMGGGQMPEGMTPTEGGAGGGMGDMTEEERAEMQNGEMPEGMGERQQGENGGTQRPEGAGGAGAMGGGMQQAEGQDYSEIVTLTDETRTFNVPVTTPVVQFGTEMTFSQITEDMYITVMLDESDNLTSINILG